MASNCITFHFTSTIKEISFYSIMANVVESITFLLFHKHITFLLLQKKLRKVMCLWSKRQVMSLHKNITFLLLSKLLLSKRQVMSLHKNITFLLLSRSLPVFYLCDKRKVMLQKPEKLSHFCIHYLSLLNKKCKIT